MFLKRHIEMNGNVFAVHPVDQFDDVNEGWDVEDVEGRKPGTPLYGIYGICRDVSWLKGAEGATRVLEHSEHWVDRHGGWGDVDKGWV